MKASFASLLLCVLALSSSTHSAPTKPNDSFITLGLTKLARENADMVQGHAVAISRYASELGDRSELKKRSVSSALISDSDGRLVVPTIVGNETIDLIFDTGSSDIVVESSSYHPGKTAVNTGKTFSNYYSGGGLTTTGPVYLDQVTIGNVKTDRTPILHATTDFLQPGEPTHHGILGLSLNFSYHKTYGYSTFLESLFPQNPSLKKVFSSWVGADKKGALYLGGYDSTKFSGQLSYVPINNTDASPYWQATSGVKINGIEGTALVDSGTSFIYTPTLALLKSLAAKYGLTVTEEPENHIAYVETSCTSKSIANVSINSLTRSIPNTKYNNKCIWPIVSFGTDKVASGGSWVLGFPVYEQFFISHDYGAKRIGFAAPK